MPELPELEVTRERLEEALGGRIVRTVTVHDPFVLRTVDPPISSLAERPLTAVRRQSKHLVLDLESGLSLVIHLMLGGRLHLKPAAKFKPHRKRTLLSILWDDDTILEMTEAGTKRRASVSLHEGDLPERVTRGEDPLGKEFTVPRLRELLSAGNHQLKTVLRDPNRISGIGNAYSDEILHAARLSPLRLTSRLTDEEVVRLHAATSNTLRRWIQLIRERCPQGLPTKQSLWRRDMAVHGRPGEPCPACSDTIQRISFKDSETHYCPGCQNGGKLLADRRLSRFGVRRREHAD